MAATSHETELFGRRNPELVYFASYNHSTAGPSEIKNVFDNANLLFAPQ